MVPGTELVWRTAPWLHGSAQQVRGPGPCRAPGPCGAGLSQNRGRGAPTAAQAGGEPCREHSPLLMELPGLPAEDEPKMSFF